MSSDKSKQHDGPLESKYWHFRCNDVSEEQYQHLLTIDCEYINIGAIEPNKTRTGSHFHTIIKFKRSYGLGSVKKLLLLNQKLNPFDWYMATKYTRTKSLEHMVKYAIKNGSRYETTANNNTLPPIQDIEHDVNPTKGLTPDELFDLRYKKCQLLDIHWFSKYDKKFSLTQGYKTMVANCQHREDLTNLTRLCNWYIWGPPGLGKSSLIDFMFPGCYKKIRTNDKMDSYSNYKKEHEVVVFDELDTVDAFDRCMGGLEEFKTWSDVYPFPVRNNYGFQQIMIRPKRIVITSNLDIHSVLATENRSGRRVQHFRTVLSAFRRRFREMTIEEAHEFTGTYFDPIKKRTFYKKGVKYFNTETDEIEYEDNVDELLYDLSGET